MIFGLEKKYLLKYQKRKKMSSIVNGSEFNDIIVISGNFNDSSLVVYNVTPTYQVMVNTSERIQTLSTSASGNFQFQIPFYMVILMLSIFGNLLVITTLVQNRRMRTITNVFLLNLAFSDILLGVLCVPFTLVGTILRDFIFGEALCKLIPFLQATSVAVSSWTLVAISLERYYAICHPLTSRTWQTLKHSYKIIAFIWIGGTICMAPIIVYSQLQTTKYGGRKCREFWPAQHVVYERIYNIFLDLVLFMLPLIILCFAYSSIIKTLYKGIQRHTIMEIPNSHSMNNNNDISELQVAEEEEEGGDQFPCDVNTSKYTCKTADTVSNIPAIKEDYERRKRISFSLQRTQHFSRESTNQSLFNQGYGNNLNESALRRTNTQKALENKKRVVKMLFVVVMEFFICWTPLYVINTITLFDKDLIYKYVGYTAISFFQLLAYSSSCCNPITYCFMNSNFRKAFLDAFKGLRGRQAVINPAYNRSCYT
ncbi:CCKAR.2 family protein [Megaselia abdita]